jgi:hypothetical protein
MAMDFNAARLIVEAAKKRGAIQAPGDPEIPVQPDWKSKEPGSAVLPDWLKEEGTGSYRDSRRR